jgi:hypothetical protein
MSYELSPQSRKRRIQVPVTGMEIGWGSRRNNRSWTKILDLKQGGMSYVPYSEFVGD